jgi:c-di-GMP-binding flagellar brake protein YcgR
MVQQRRFFRVEVDFACVFSLLGGDDSAGKGREEYRAILRDISGGGVCIVTDRKLAKGDLLQLSITIPRQPSNTVSSGGMAGKSGGTPLRGGLRNITAPPAPATETIDVQGQVVHLADIPSEGWPLFATGVEFRQVSNRLEERLMTLVFDLQRSQCLRR